MDENSNSIQLSSSTDETEMNESEDTVNMVEIVNYEDEQDKMAAELIGEADLNQCTYPLGYLPRQSVYACLTCSDRDDVSSGICVACHLTCHRKHDVVELYSKRLFRCDCGNSKFPKNPCKLFADKSPINERNIYNHNYHNRFCHCDAFYDPNMSNLGDMIQCCICEDWFHFKHAGATPASNQDYICRDCFTKYPFLQFYANNEINTTLECYISECKPSTRIESSFPNKNWRKSLCKCLKCYEMYIVNDVSFLLEDEEDADKWHEKCKKSSDIDIKKIFSQLNPSERRKIDIVNEYYCDMAIELKEYLNNFYETGKVVTKKDIEDFFEYLSERTKNRLRP